jgi:hypothetical protein
MDRRSFILGAVAVVASPAIVRAASLMPVKAHRYMPFDKTAPHQKLIDFKLGNHEEPYEYWYETIRGTRYRVVVNKNPDGKLKSLELVPYKRATLRFFNKDGD